MAFLQIKNVSIVGLSAAVPSEVSENSAIYSKWGDYKAFLATTGIERRHIADKDVCTSDLCVAAAEKLIKELSWEKNSIDAVIFVTQTQDYLLPATACIIQDRLKLSERCYCLDISLGCSGWVYGLSVLASLMQNGTIKRGLLLAGDTPSHKCSPDDKSTYPLFGDAGSAAALQYGEGDMLFSFNTDGSDFKTIIIEDGGCRHPFNKRSLEPVTVSEGVVRNPTQLVLDGMNVFSFSINKAPDSVNGLIDRFNLDKSQIDYFVFHQGNKFMNEMIRQKLDLPKEKVPYSLKNYGNTSSASIPITMVTELKEQLENGLLHFLCCGFGVGLSWGSVYFETKKMICPSIIEL